jgi:hypothetical protein
MMTRGLSILALAKRKYCFDEIGRNEIAAMRICQELVDAQKEYYAESKH